MNDEQRRAGPFPDEWFREEDRHSDGRGDGQHQPRAQQHPYAAAGGLPHPRPAAPPPSWGGEADGDATAFVALPPDSRSAPGGDPLAAPGYGFKPPEIGTAAGPFPPGGPVPSPPPTVGATTDPTATGAWALPFAEAVADTRDEPARPADGERGGGTTSAGGPPSAAAAMGQGAAAALAGFHQGRMRRRSPDEEAEEGTAPRAGGPTDDAPADAWPPSEDTPSSGVRIGVPAASSPASSAPSEDWARPGDSAAGQAAADWSAPEAPPVGHGGFPTQATGERDRTAAEQPAPPAAAPDASSEHPTVSYSLRVNGVDRQVTDAWIGESLLYVLRERLGLAGAKDGCSQGECGACSVQVDGRLVVACLVPAATAASSEIKTVEGLSPDGEPSDVQRALAATGPQCGFCLPGMAMTVTDLLEGNHRPSSLETRRALCGNLCRCTGYRGVLGAVREVADSRAAAAAEESSPVPSGNPGARQPGEPEPPAGQDEAVQEYYPGGVAIPRQPGPGDGRGGDT